MTQHWELLQALGSANNRAADLQDEIDRLRAELAETVSAYSAAQRSERLALAATARVRELCEAALHCDCCGYWVSQWGVLRALEGGSE